MYVVAVLIVEVVSILALGMGVFGLASPAGMIALVARWQSETGLWAASILRLVFGVALWLVAAASRTPLILQALAVLSMTAALVLPFVGVSRFESILSWWRRQSPAFVRAWSAVAVIFGVFLLWSVAA
jgi:hypothetical protein